MRRGPQNLLDALAGVDHTSALQAPPPVNPSQPTGQVGTTNPGAALLSAYQQWMDRTGNKSDPLLAQVGHRRESLGGTQGANPVSLLTQSSPLVASHGANAGKQAFAVDLGDGRRAHIYYDERGRRQVRVFRPTAQP